MVQGSDLIELKHRAGHLENDYLFSFQKTSIYGIKVFQNRLNFQHKITGTSGKRAYLLGLVLLEHRVKVFINAEASCGGRW